MTFTTDEIAALVIALSFAAGLNVPGTVVTLGLLGRSGVIALPEPLALVSDWWVIGPAAALFLFEFVADKIAGLDLIWNALQTFIRVPAGAMLAWSATASLSPRAQLVALVGGAVISLIAHSGKLAIRGAVTASPEPVSNILVSTAEDVAAIGLTWFAATHPYLAATLAVVALVTIVLMIRWVWRTARAFWRRRPAMAEVSR
jgi:hypothetical protein